MAGLRVLVVDDEPTILQVLKGFFDQRGDACDVASSGFDAVRLVEDRIYDLMLSDLSMPGMTGLELTERVKKLQPHTVCLLMSGYGTRGDIIAALKVGVFEFIDKPILELATLTMAVERAAESGRLTRERDALLQSLRDQNAKLEYSLFRLHEAFGQLRQQEEAVASDLQKAQRVQRSFLPAAFPQLPGFDLFGYYAPCDQLGGDFFGTLTLRDGRTALYLVDVTGHGVSAAMITVTLRELMRAGQRASATEDLFADPAGVLRYLNEALLEEKFEPPIFVSMVYGVLDANTGEMSLASAGHPAPILVNAAGDTSTVAVRGCILGSQPECDAEVAEVRLNPGDALLFYSDGLSEARDAAGHEFTAARLGEIMRESHGASARVASERLEHEFLEHLHGEPPADDITFLVVSRSTVWPARSTNGSAEVIPDSVKVVMPDKQPAARAGLRGQMHAGFRENAFIVQLSGVVTWQLGGALRELLEQAKGRASPPFLIDLAECEALDSTMLGLLLQLATELVLHRPGGRVISQLHEMGVLHLFTIRHDPCPPPKVAMAVSPSTTQQACSELILSAHEALMEASNENREKFKDIVDTLREQSSSPPA